MLTLGKVKAYSRTKRKCGDHLAGDLVATEAFLSHFWKSSKKKGGFLVRPKFNRDEPGKSSEKRSCLHLRYHTIIYF